MIIDGHSHVTLPVEQHIRLMDEAGVDRTVLFSTVFHPEKSKDEQELKEQMRFLNGLLAGKKGSMTEARRAAVVELMDVLHRYPDRFIGFGAVPVGLDAEVTMQVVDQNIHANHLAGIGEFALGTGQVFQLEPVFQASGVFGNLPLWVHGFFPLTLNDLNDLFALAKKYPDVPVIVGHLGGSNWIETMEAVRKTPNLYLDLSAYFSTFVLGMVIHALPEKCFFGVDMPYGDLQLSIDAIRKAAGSKPIEKAVLGGNIARLLHL